jgi:membrane protease YdiL (CAAX protease family)
VSVSAILNALIVALAAFGVSYWAFRARSDRSAYVGLYLLFGIPAVLLASVALAQVLVGGPEDGILVLLLGLGLGLPLLPPLRRLLARVTPIDPRSPVDMAGLCVTFFALAWLVGPTASAAPMEDVPAVGTFELVLQVVLYLVLAYAAVGWWFARPLGAATERLGITPPTPRVVGAALGGLAVGMAVTVAVNLVGAALQPDVAEALGAVTEEITAEVQNPVGAMLLGVSAGVGEEAIFRGALQPRFGIVLTSIVFALLHTQYGINFAVVGIFALSVVLGLLRQRFGTTAAMITHALFNFLVVLAQTYGP